MSNNDYKELDLIPVLKVFWLKRKVLLGFIFVFFITGLVVSLLTKEIYSSSTTFIPNTQEGSNSSSLGGVASLVGLNLGRMSSSSEIPPSMYPLVTQSVEFKRLLLAEYIDLKNEITLKKFISDSYGVKVENDAPISINPLYVSEYENTLFEILSSNILSINVNDQDGFITLSANSSVGAFSAAICQNARSILQKIIINNKISSAKQNLKYSEKQLKEKRVVFDKIQNELATFDDSNLNIVNSSIINKRNRLEAEFQIINAVIVELSKQVEQNKLQVSKDTPVFSIIKEASIPIKRSQPERKKIVFLYCFIGLLCGGTYVGFKDYVVKLIKVISS